MSDEVSLSMMGQHSVQWPRRHTLAGHVLLSRSGMPGSYHSATPSAHLLEGLQGYHTPHIRW